MSHRALPGDPPPVVMVVKPSAPKVFTRAEVAGLAEMERQINHAYNWNDEGAWYWTRKLAEMDGTLAIQGAA